MHVLVTGGAGFIGSHSTERLLEAGATVRVLDNFSTGRRANLQQHPRLTIAQGDIRDAAVLDAAFEGIDHVLHLAALVSVTASVADPVASAQVNLGGFLNVLDAARRHAVKRFVYASSSAVYGMPGDAPSREDSAGVPGSPYGLEKFVNDQYASLYARLFGMSTLGLRYFNVFGPRQDPSSPYSGVISIFMQRLRDGQALTIFGDGCQTRDFVYVGDIARVNAQALATPLKGVCNVGTGKATGLLQLAELMGEVTMLPPVLQFEAPRQGDIVHSCADATLLREVFDTGDFFSVSAGLWRLWHFLTTRSDT